MEIWAQLVVEVVRRRMKKKTQYCRKGCVLSNAWIWDLSRGSNQFNLFLKNYVTSEGAGSHNVLYHDQQLLSIARNQVSFYANNYFE